MFAPYALAHAGETPEVEVEAIYDNYEAKESKQHEQKQAEKAKQIKQKTEVNTLSDLVELSPFKDIAVIQKRYMPKTNRFEFSSTIGTSVNNAFYTNWGFVGKLGYYWNEQWGLEAMYYWLNSSQRDITNKLHDKQGVETRSLVVPENFLGLAVKWVPIYGKVAWFNKRIIPFDLFFAAGGGLSKTGLNESEPTVHLSAGQLFYVSKSWGVRWDIAINSYNAKILKSNGTSLVETSKYQTDLFMAIGAVFYFPEASYR